jgi:hypothetical protein
LKFPAHVMGSLGWASVRECHSTTGKHGAALVVMWAGDLPNDA